MGSQSGALDFVEEVTARYGSVEAYFAQLRAEVDEPDEEPTEQLPVIERLPRSSNAATQQQPDIAAQPTPRQATQPTDRTAYSQLQNARVRQAAPPQQAVADSGRKRNAAAAVWRRLTGRG
ncbi:hypothetical protein [Nocardia sp. N2S4-5]|uniref:hypothetical protein n=1 Tax=Nocardia sp. N2S4-5 TaxID=3351565 RepID=UPI0037CFF044